ncbi:putative pyrroloquinoline-quinone binding quinoprotein [Micromonospora sp. M71_S20]|uniref:outer membrane protein assembly factor BamB family protein n=1 Tax=Micromonospora sp. M71_S20 TaxID=592872 RepID=UPI000EAFF081|nr:PQQ-binding-like beta-propeller repeat protein [Micromonospora sp. M71_S20]RLK25414.1 putative pyrroloquinoline-quinone binding quinoprotein [Micromonospora sp. M71_S20]
MILGLTACTGPRAEPPERPALRVEVTQESLRGSETGAEQEGPEPTWSVTADRLDQPLTQLGQVIVVPDERELRAVDRSTGQDRWRHPFPVSYQYTVAGDLIVLSASDGGPLEVLDAATGATRWRAEDTQDVVVQQKVVYDRECVGTGRSAKCVVVARDLHDGRQLWKLTADRFARVSDEALGVRAPYAAPTDRYVAVRLDGRTYTTVAPTTGKAGAGRLPSRAWHGFVADGLLVTTDHDPPRDDRRCTVSIATVDAATGARGWSGEVFSGRREDGECAKRLAHDRSGLTLLGAGTRLVAVTAAGRPQVIDLRTGRTQWEGAASGVPVDGDDRSVLVRRNADEGELALLDAATGATRWSAPDPGLSGTSASWRSSVTKRLVAVSGAADERPVVLVHDVSTGRQLGRYPGWLAGAGDDWVAVSHSGGPDGIALDLYAF